MTSPWGKVPTVEPVNLQDIMSEEVAKDLQQKENRFYMESLHGHNETTSTEDDNTILNTATCKSDEMIAMMLQKQYDKEYDDMLKRTENKFNGDSKVSISYANFRRSDSTEESESDDDLVDIIDRKDWDRFDNVERSLNAMPRCGYMKQENGNMVTKHDSTLTGRKNACKFMSFPPEFHTGDGAGFDLQLSNKVFNSLKAHSRNEQARRHRMHDKKEDRATAELGIDEYTRLLLYKLINGLLERVNGVISTGKEAVILHADTDQTYEKCVLPHECVVKVFKTTLSEFKQRDKYIKDDYRFKERYGSKQNSRKMVTLWAEKEMHNLVRLQKSGIPCPEVIALKKHILVMSFIGENHKPAPKLKDVILSNADIILAYEQVIDTMKKLYKEAKLVHADLSEYNILWHDNQCWFIDVGQSVEPSHPNAHMFLYRDCTNIATFFTRKGVSEVKTPSEIFNEITGFDYHRQDPTSLSKDNQKVKPHLVDHPDVEKQNVFDYEWEKSKDVLNEQPVNITSDINNLILLDQPIS